MNAYEGRHYLLAALKYKLTHIGIRLELVPIENQAIPASPDGYNLDRARLYYDKTTKKTIEIRRG